MTTCYISCYRSLRTYKFNMQSETASQISKSLVADYDSSSNEEDEPVSSEPSTENSAVPLISASEMLSKNSSEASSSVFINPYRLAEHYEHSVLEKHVKMTQVKEPDLKNKRACFKFSKGKCKLGDKCPFQHVSSVQTNDLNGKTTVGEETNETFKVKLKKRSGLKDDLIPPKKYMKVYNSLK